MKHQPVARQFCECCRAQAVSLRGFFFGHAQCTQAIHFAHPKLMFNPFGSCGSIARTHRQIAGWEWFFQIGLRGLRGEGDSVPPSGDGSIGFGFKEGKAARRSGLFRNGSETTPRSGHSHRGCVEQLPKIAKVRRFRRDVVRVTWKFRCGR